MGAFFVRRLVGGAVQVFLAGILLYSLLVPVGISSVLRSSHPIKITSPGMRANPSNPQFVRAMYSFDKPWPFSYLAWLFDTNSVPVDAITFPAYTNYYGNGEYDYLPAKTVTSVPSGVIAGNLGFSVVLIPGANVLVVLGLNGPSLPLLVVLPLAMVLFFMAIVVLQRRGRPHFYGVASPSNPARRVWRRAEVWPLG